MEEDGEGVIDPGIKMNEKEWEEGFNFDLWR